MNYAMIMMFAAPLFSIVLVGSFQVWDEMFGNRHLSPIEGLDRPTADIQFGAMREQRKMAVVEPLVMVAALPYLVPASNAVLPFITQDAPILQSLAPI
jgi:hypothetical protein